MPPKKRFNEVAAALAGMQNIHWRSRGAGKNGQSVHTLPRSYGGEYRPTQDDLLYFKEVEAIPRLTRDEEIDLLTRMLEENACVEVREGLLKEIGVQIDCALPENGGLKKDGALAILHKKRSELVRARDAAKARYQDAYSKFTAAHLRLVISLARGFYPYAHGMSMGDLIQEGNLGLMRAVSRFDLAYRDAFSTYAVWWISSCITRAITAYARSVRIPPHIIETNTQYINQALELYGDREAVLSPEELDMLVKRTGKSKRTIANAREAMAIAFVPLDKEIPYGRGSVKILDLLSVRNENEERIDESALAALVHKAIGKLSPRSRLIIEQRYGIFGPERTLKEVGDDFGLSRERVRQIEQKATDMLRHWLRIYLGTMDKVSV